MNGAQFHKLEIDFGQIVVLFDSMSPDAVNDMLESEKNFLQIQRIDLMHDDVTHPEREYGSCSHAQIQDGRQ